MSLLSYNELVELVERGVITGVRDGAINASSIDIHLAPKILVEGNRRKTVTFAKREPLGMYDIDLRLKGGFDIPPGGFLLASSVEMFNLPANISAQYRLKSSMARIGLEHLNAGHCFVGETEVPILDGTSVKIADLVGKQVWVYSLDELGEFVPGFASRIWKTKEVSETVIVHLDNEQFFECTPEHLIMARDGQYVEAQYLQCGQPLMPFYRKPDPVGYELIYCPSTVKKSNWVSLRGRWKKTHVLTDAEINGPLPKGMAVHHKDHVRVNNLPENLERMDAIEHAILHCVERNQTSKMRAAAAEAARKVGIKSWQSPDFRAMKTENNRRNAAFTNNKRWGTPIPPEYLNHKVARVERRVHNEPVPVYDMTVDKWHNFALTAGVFVHNCDAGWNGSALTLELKNITQFHTIRLTDGDPIGQMVFFKHEEVPAERSYAARGRYNRDETVSGIKE